MNLELFETSQRQILSAEAAVLRGFALNDEAALLAALRTIIARAPFRHMVTPGGFEMSVAMTNCGDLGWISDHKGYRYDHLDPLSGNPGPTMPVVLKNLAATAATVAGFAGFTPDACLINRYQPGARLTMHQDKNEKDFHHPIVSVSLGIPAVFLFGGHKRMDKAARIALMHGDVVVWGGADRLRYHGVLPLKPGIHSLLGAQRVNLTFRKAG